MIDLMDDETLPSSLDIVEKFLSNPFSIVTVCLLSIPVSIIILSVFFPDASAIIILFCLAIEVFLL